MLCPTCRAEAVGPNSNRCAECGSDLREVRISPSGGIVTALVAWGIVFIAARHTRALFLLLGLLAVAHALTVLGGFLLSAKLMGVAVREVGLFWGTIVRFRVGQTFVRIGWLPIMGYVSHYAADDAKSLPRLAVGRLWNDVAPLQRIVMALSGPIVGLAAALIILGPAEGGRSFAKGFAQPFSVLLGNISPTVEVVAFLTRLEQGEWLAPLGTLLAKLSAINLLPLTGVTSGGIALVQIVEWSSQRNLPERTVNRAAAGGLFILLALLLPWGYALLKVLFAGTEV